MSPDTWNPSSIEPHIVSGDPDTLYRVLPPQHLLSQQLTHDSATAELVHKAVQRAQQRTTPPSETTLSVYDDELAFVFKHPHLQGGGRFSRRQANQGTLYAAFAARTALAERAFHHLRFIREQGGDLDSLIPVSQIAFKVTAMNRVDVRHPPFRDDPGFLEPGTTYTDTQQFADAARRTPAHAIKYTKPAMIAKATADARAAARQFAQDSGSEAGQIRSASQGYFSIQDLDSYTPDVKKVRVVTTIDYALDD